ncbi:MAG: ABC transporter permease, partial [Planctomycetota bacterium]
QPPPRVPPHPTMPRQSQRGHVVDHVQLVSQTQQGSLAGDSFTIVREDVLAGDKSNPKIAMYAAGIAVMFLLFSATGAGGSLLEDYEAGTLDRILTSRIGLTQLLAGKWLYITFLGCLQLTVMFGWAAAVFRVELRDNLEGFAAMTLVTAAATASFALCLATLARSRAQLQGLSIVLILTMSALGGSMIPRYIMSENMQRWGLFTFNAWALDGYKKVFWHELPVAALQHELIVLGSMAIILAIVARFFADRWAAD